MSYKLRIGIGAALVLLAGISLFGIFIYLQTLSFNKPAEYTGRLACLSCHEKEYKLWENSHHDLAMQPASEKTVLGNFDDQEFDYYGIKSRFFKKDGDFFIHTDGADGKLQDFKVKYVFGVIPLQQYLIEFPGGRLQCSSLAWDDIKKEWYHLYPNEKINHDEWLHWTKGGQNWNLMCAECHSTNLQKNFNPETDSYNTTWSEIDVSCEACHGPSSVHLKWEQQGSLVKKFLPEKTNELRGLTAKYKGVDSRTQVMRCGRCHSRRARFTVDYQHNGVFEDHFIPSLLEPGIYHVDGQILNEDYVYGSFVQTKMYHQNVQCTDCHDPHSHKLVAAGNELCGKCHVPATYDTSLHHFHEKNTESGQCVSCHMTGEIYMGIDFRRDHSFRRPRPDLSVKYGMPNACSKCHTDSSAQWAAEWINKWYGPNRVPHFADILQPGRDHKPGADIGLVKLIKDTSYAAIVRATAINQLKNYPGSNVTTAFISLLDDEEPLVRHYAVGALDRLPVNQKIVVVGKMLSDSVRTVRMEAANILADVPKTSFSPEQLKLFDTAITDYKERLRYSADFASGQMNIGIFHSRLGKTNEAVNAYEKAIKIDNLFSAARINLASLYNQQKRNAEAEQQLRKVIKDEPGFGDVYYSLGLLLAEEKRLDEAVEYLKEASIRIPENPRIHYNFGLALQNLKRYSEAETALLKAESLMPQSGEYVYALAILHMQQGQWSNALVYAEKLASLAPQDPNVAQLIKRIKSEINKP